MTLPEVVLWQALRNGHLARWRFRRQHPIGPYILDFYSASARLAVEVDGLAHDTINAASHDERRRAWLWQRRISLLRLAAADVLGEDRLEGVLLAIAGAAEGAPSVELRSPPPPQAGEEPGPAPPILPRSRGRGTMRSMVEGASGRR